MLRLAFSSFAWCLYLWAAGAQAQVYKCIDASGKTTYLQSPCPAGAKSSAISRTVPEPRGVVLIQPRDAGL